MGEYSKRVRSGAKGGDGADPDPPLYGAIGKVRRFVTGRFLPGGLHDDPCPPECSGL